MLISDMLPGVLTDAPECPDVEAEKALLRSAIELCTDAQVWNEVQETPVILVDGVSTYDVDIPEDAQLVTVMNVWLRERELRPADMSKVAREIPNWTVATAPEPVYFNCVMSLSSLRVFPTPLNAQSQPMILRAAYAPTLQSTEIPDDIATKYEELLKFGALGRLLLQPRKPWSDARLGAFYADRFKGGKVDARLEVIRDGAPGSITAKAVSFGF